MDRLWAPWRTKYVLGKKKKGCIICQALNLKSALIFKGKFSFCMLNIYPYNNGHLMVSPSRHVKDTNQLNDQELLDLFKSVNKAKELLQKALKPHGFNIGMNLSRAAGAGITGHLHIHIVPRWVGDTNFMPVTGETKIISQSLKELQKKLKKILC